MAVQAASSGHSRRVTADRRSVHDASVGAQTIVLVSQVNPEGHPVPSVVHAGTQTCSSVIGTISQVVATGVPAQSKSDAHGAHTAGANATQVPRPRSQIGAPPPHWAGVALFASHATHVPARHSAVGASHVTESQGSGGAASGIPASRSTAATHAPDTHSSRGPHGRVSEQLA